MPSTKRKRVPSAKLRAAEEGDSEDNADTVKAIAHSVKAAAKKGKPAAGKADSVADKTSSAAAKGGTGKASAGTAEEGKAKADEGKVRAAVPAFAADSDEGEVTKKGTRVMRAPSWAGVSRQNSVPGAMPEMSLKSFDESMQQLFTGGQNIKENLPPRPCHWRFRFRSTSPHSPTHPPILGPSNLRP
mmetsp:Transcript_46061/g.128132  ORF Transcript_46061/g.128132 Transcript_46061/m.128132 type:complete len:187 (+) Transcript_46061:195-755(+)